MPVALGVQQQLPVPKVAQDLGIGFLDPEPGELLDPLLAGHLALGVNSLDLRQAVLQPGLVVVFAERRCDVHDPRALLQRDKVGGDDLEGAIPFGLLVVEDGFVFHADQVGALDGLDDLEIFLDVHGQAVEDFFDQVLGEDEGFAFGMFDEDTKRYYVEEGLDFPMGILYAETVITVEKFDAEFQQALDEGVTSIFKADSIEEIAAGTGLDKDKLTATIEEYNRCCDTGRDEIFHKNPKFLRPVRKPPFYVSKMAGAHSLGSMGGIKINYKTEVVNKEDDVIPGLYAAGLDSNTIYGDSYTFLLPGNTFGFALNSGRIAGENAAKFALGE